MRSRKEHTGLVPVCKCLIYFIFFIVLGADLLYAQADSLEEAEDSMPSEIFPNAPAAEIQADETEISYNLRRNKYFLESLRLKSMANLAITEGEYEQSEYYSSEAMRYAQLSDEYIAEQLKRKRALDAIAEAREYLAWAKLAEAEKYYPTEYEEASEHYAAACQARDIEDWPGALENALLTGRALAAVAAPPPRGVIPENLPKFPSKYTVRPWDEFGDCFWNIAYWFYKDHYKWPALYEANKEKLPDINNPDILEVGTIIDIPEIENESRAGMWDSGIPYKR
jgi:hypothetical protein